MKGISNINDSLVMHDIGVWDQNGDINPLEDLKNINFKDYDGYTWNGYVSIKKEDTYRLGLITKKNYFEYSKAIIPKLIIDSGFDINNVKWYACLHLDSEKNFNFHFFFMEIKKNKNSFNDRLISKNAIKKFKSNALNYLINRNDILKLKDELFINVTKEVKLQNLSKIDKDRIFKTSLEKKLNKLYKELPKEHILQYNSPNLNNVRPLIDSIIWDILSHPSIRKYYYDYINVLHNIDRQNVQYYGVSKDKDYTNNQIHKLYSKIGNDILSNYKNYKNELYLENQKEFLSKNIFKLDLKSNKDITYERKLELGQELYKIGSYLNLNKNQLKFLVKKWYFNSNLNGDFNYYYNEMSFNINNKTLTTNEFYRSLNSLGISYSKYKKIKQNYYNQRFVYNKIIYNSFEYIKYVNERIEKEIVQSMRDELEY